MCVVVEQLNTVEGRESDSFSFWFVEGEGEEGVLKETTDVLKHSRWIHFVAEPGKRLKRLT